MTTATIEQPTAMPVQQTAAPVQQKATPSHQAANPRFNYRIMAGFDDRQAENIRVLQKKMGGATESALMRTAVDLLCFVHGLDVDSDPSIFLRNYLVLSQGGTNGQ